MLYQTTRGAAPELDFTGVLLTGLARDGGLFVPSHWPKFSVQDWQAMVGLPYAEVAKKLMAPFVEGSIPQADFAAMVDDTYRNFYHPAVAPLTQIGGNEWVLELFHGQTIAFKDYALQLLGRLFDYSLTRAKRRAVIVGATSGDTGSAAIEACRDREAIDIFILFPHGKVSEFQRRQMTTVTSKNVHAIAIDGSFDDAQAIVKGLFNDHDFRDEVGMAAINSINWARIMAQIVYYATSSLSLGAPSRQVDFVVPTGNFGNIYAGYAARQMGLPIGRLVLATNQNDILARWLASGTMATAPVKPSISPSMDIQISSNVERLIYELFDRDSTRLNGFMTEFAKSGKASMPDGIMSNLRTLFHGHAVDDKTTLETMRSVYDSTGEKLDPHSAIAVHALLLERSGSESPAEKQAALVALACAHPAKFADAVTRAYGQPVPPPKFLSGIESRPERNYHLPGTTTAVKEFIRNKINQG
ncbi:MAG: threonine synthase [Candidatus Pacebacteria bacterium]|nr:threonine synthase [Candidatus Paceibacterota bacterium]